jgi:UDP-N-acetylmuramoyl-tripeptide--D-alanyl-D-alanine ligase
MERIGTLSVIDDTYNANPSSMQAACDVLEDWDTEGKKLFVAGDMLELGDRTAEWHRSLGAQAAAASIDCLLAFGDHAEAVLQGARETGMTSNQLAGCRDLGTLLTVLECWLEPGDVVLVKGSRAMRMERVIEWLRRLEDSADNETLSRIPLRACA